MSVFPSLDQSNGQIELAGEDLAKKQKEIQSEKVRFWRQRIDSAAKTSVYTDFKKSKDSAKAFFKGKIFTKKEEDDWEGDTLQANLFRRTVNFMSEAVYSQNPNIHVRSRSKFVSNTPEKSSEVIEEHLKYVFEEEDLRGEVRRVWKDSYFGNLSAAKIDFDVSRGLWRAKWVAGLLILDPDARGDVSRARWMAEQVVLPRYRVWQDETFDINARNEIKAKQSQTDISYSDRASSNAVDPNDQGRAENQDNEVLWYIYTKEGMTPLKYGVNSAQDQQMMDGGSKNRLLILCEGYDGWLLDQPDPTPFLDDDEFPYAILRLDELPGEFIGPPLWELVKSVVLGFNWAASYHMSDMRITSARTIAYDKNKIDDPNKAFKSRKHQISVPCEGSPKDVVAPLDKGQADKTIFDSVQFFYGLLDKLTGIDEIARGEEGRTKTATESQILQQNSNIALRGPSAALDRFLNDLIRKLGLASLYYTPAFSIVPHPTTPGIFMTRSPQQLPVVDPLSGMPAIDPMTGMPSMQTQLIPTIAEGATHPVKGIDYFHGDEVALNWPTIPFDQIKCDTNFAIEAGSTRAERRMEKKQEVAELMQTLGVELQLMGMHGERWELWNKYLDAFDIADKSKLLPSKEIYVQMAMQAQMMQMQAQAAGAGGAENSNPNKFKEEKNAGKDFPMNSQPGKDKSSGSGN